MVTINRLGSMMQIPRKLSHHVPRVPILDSEDFVERTQKFFSLDMDEFQLYKMAQVEEYSVSEVAAMEVVGMEVVGGGGLSLANFRAHKLYIDGKEVTKEQMLEILKAVMGKKSVEELERMLAEGWSIEQLIEHFKEHGKTEKEELEEAVRVLEQIRNEMKNKVKKNVIF